jgi:type I restriction enzyme M protein
MEDEVLANAGVDVFEEVFKLIFTKLFDEWSSGRKGQSGKRQLEFYNSGQTETELKEKIQNLFDAAKKKWRGVFKTDDKITLTGSHLMVCVSYLERYKLFNSNLDVVDEAFEYLINQSSKGEKGQYFTPRYVIDMCVKMLNPKEDESMIDTAAGSSGFPVHSMFHVWRQIYEDEGLEQSDMFTAEEKLPRCVDYVKEKVFAIDFDEKAVRVARTLNLIAGDGETNVLHLNTLDYKRWKERIEDTEWQKIYSTGLWRFLEFQAGKKDDYKNFLFDIMMANPPFAGDIKESVIVSSYDLVRDKVGKGNKGVGRDILFIERNLDFLKPGGRMAVVLPQGRFNNSSDKYIRDFIADRCRILAVVGLHGNTFKPHTGTKTSVLFLQKWNDDPQVGSLCPKKDDYNIFFATMQKSGKDNSGEKIYVKASPLAPLKNGGKESDFLLDEHGHRIVDHDLFNHDGLTQDGIAEAFMEFAKKEALSFFDLGSSVTPFDAVKYARLMDELEVSEIMYSKLEFSGRIDSEYYRPEFLKIETKIISKKYCELKEEVNFLIGPFGSSFIVENYDETSPYRYVRGRDVKHFFVRDDENVNMPKEDYERLLKYKLNKNDLLISVVGTLGNVSIVTDDVLPAIFSCKSTVVRSKNISFSKYLLAYLNSEGASHFFMSINA